MEDSLPDIVRDYKIETRFISRREVAHVYDDPNAPPSSQQYEEYWKSEKRPIGSGGQGQVYLQKCFGGRQIGAVRAVKVIPFEGAGGKRRYLRELEAIIKFSHPRYSRYLVNSLGWYESNDSLHIAMEYFPAGDLQTHCIGDRMDEDDTRHIISQVVRGLEFMHREGFSHGDIKPKHKNVLIKQLPTSEGPHTWWVKLADFGITKRVIESSGKSTVVGTLEFMAPELSRGLTDVNYPAADMWAVGAMAFRMLTEAAAFSSPFEALRYLDHPDGLFPYATLNKCEVSQDGQAFIRALLSPPNQRLDSKAALLQEWVSSCIPSAPPRVLSTGSGYSTPSSTPSSAASSRRGSLDDETGMTTQLSTIRLSKPAILPKNSSRSVDKSPPDVWGLRRTLKGHTDCVYSVAFSPDSKLLASGSHDKTARLWDTDTGRLRQTLKGHKNIVKSVCFAPDSTLLASASRDTTVRLWDIPTMQPRQSLKGQLQQTLKGPTKKTLCVYSDAAAAVAFSPDSKLVASASENNQAQLWDRATWRLRQTLRSHKEGVYSVAFSPDSKLLASGSGDKTVKLWNAATGQLQKTLRGHTDSVVSVAFSPDSTLLASASLDATIQLWDIATGQLRQTPKSHEEAALAVAFSPDSKLLASASRDKTIKLWNVVTGRLQQTLQGHTDDVYSVSFSPDSKLLASGSSDKTVLLWDIAIEPSYVTAELLIMDGIF